MRRSLLLVMLAVAGHVAGHVAAHAGVFDRDDTVRERGTPVELAAIGVVTGGHAIDRATGFLVGACEVLTVKHAAGRIATTLGERLMFTQATPGGRRSAGTVIAQGDHDQIHHWLDRDRHGDWLVLRLDHCLGRDVGFVRLDTAPFYRSGHWAPGSPPIQSAGFPTGRAWQAGITRDPQCRVRMLEHGLYLNDCAAIPGNSGSPLFALAGPGDDHRLTVFAMQSAADYSPVVQPWTEQRGSLAIPTTDLAPAIAPFLTPA